MKMQKEIWGDKVKSRVQRWPWLVFPLVHTDTHSLICSVSRSVWGALPLRGDGVELCWDTDQLIHILVAFSEPC